MKNAKTILFASLIATIIVPLTVMSFVDASIETDSVNDTRTKTIEKINEMIYQLEANDQRTDLENENLEKLHMAKNFLLAKESNNLEEQRKYSQQIRDTLPEDYLEDLTPTTPGNLAEMEISFTSFIEELLKPFMAYAWSPPESYTGSTKYSWDCRDDGDLTGYLDGTITGYSSWIYTVMAFHYPTEKTNGPQGLGCTELDYTSTNSVVVQQEYLNWSIGCVTTTPFNTSTSTIGVSCNELSNGSFVYIHAHPKYGSNQDFSPSPSEDILYIGN